MSREKWKFWVGENFWVGKQKVLVNKKIEQKERGTDYQGCEYTVQLELWYLESQCSEWRVEHNKDKGLVFKLIGRQQK